MSGFANKYRAAWLRDILAGTSDAPSFSLLYVNLLTSLPSGEGTVSATPTGYAEWAVARKSISILPATAEVLMNTPFVGTDGVETTNAQPVTWSLSDLSGIGAGVSVVGWGVFESAGGDDLVAWDDLPTNVSVLATNEYIVPSGDMKIRMRGFS